ncbi:MAG: hypothetical protein AAGA48_19000 [Myxococcota bacterium]
MKGDFSRNSHLPDRQFSAVRFLQGRVVLDADLNEQLDIALDDRRWGRHDIIGDFGIPEDHPDDLAVALEGTTVTVAGGTAYVAGRRVTVEPTTVDVSELLMGDPNPQGSVLLGVDLEVREELVTELDDPDLVEPALLGADHSVRQRLVTEVRVDALSDFTCRGLRRMRSPLRMRPLVEPTVPGAGPCLVPSQAGFRGLDNVHVRIEVHRSDSDGRWVKWDRDNASVELEASGLVEDDGTQLLLVGPFSPAHALDRLESGDLLEIEGVGLVQYVGTDPDSRGLLVGPLGNEPFFTSTDFSGDPLRLRRWQGFAMVQLGQAFSLFEGLSAELTTGLLPPGTTPTAEEGSSWSFVARSAIGESGIGDVVWPHRTPTGDPEPAFAEAPDHLRVSLAIFDVPANGDPPQMGDCRWFFPPLTKPIASGGCATYVVDPATWRETLAELEPGEDAHVCFRPGVYGVDSPLVLSGLGHLTLSGCGEATCLRGTTVPILLEVHNCSSVTLLDLCFESLAPQPEGLEIPRGMVQLRQCATVEVHRCRLTMAPAANERRACVRVQVDPPLDPDAPEPFVSNVTITGSHFAIGDSQQGIQLWAVTDATVDDNTFETFGQASLDGGVVSAVAERAVTCDGSTVRTLSITGNRAERVSYFARVYGWVGVSVVRILDNVVTTARGLWQLDHAILVSTAERVTICGNELALDQPVDRPLPEDERPYRNGIKVEGSLGPVIRLCDNAVSHADYAIRVAAGTAANAPRMYRTTGNLLWSGGPVCYIHELGSEPLTFFVHQNVPEPPTGEQGRVIVRPVGGSVDVTRVVRPTPTGGRSDEG